MPSIRPYQRDIFQTRLNFDEYWDFVIHADCQCNDLQFGNSSDDCLAAFIDTDNPDCVEIDSLVSTEAYQFSECKNDGIVLDNIGLTGVDNGYVYYKKDSITNEDFHRLFLDSHLKYDEGDMRLHLNRIDGNNDIFDYPNVMVMTDDGFMAARLNGGFFQGFFKTSDCKYQVLPDEIGHGLAFSFKLNRTEFISDSDRTLNDKYPENKGIFMYIGTRAENKWWKLYDASKGVSDDSMHGLVDGYVNDEYTESCDAETVYTQEPPEQPYINDGYLSDEYYSLEPCCTCGLVKVETGFTNGEHHYRFTYPEALNTYQDNSIWYDEHKCIMVDNELWKTKYGHSASSFKFVTGNCDGDVVGGYLEPDYYSNKCMDKGYLLDDGYMKDDEPLHQDSELLTADGYPVNQPNMVLIPTNNKFLLFNQGDNGFKANDWDDDVDVVLHDIKIKNQENYFLLMSRCGYDVHSIADYQKAKSMHYDIVSDLYRNALAFQIKGDGSIGYKYLVKDCENEDNDYKILSEFSLPGVVPSDSWIDITILMRPVNSTQMQFWFYVNNKLRFITRPVDQLNLRALDDLHEKQEGVPFNISVGGGTQGLCDVVYSHFRTIPKHQLILEKEFGGSFVGYIKEFKFFECIPELAII